MSTYERLHEQANWLHENLMQSVCLFMQSLIRDNNRTLCCDRHYASLDQTIELSLWLKPPAETKLKAAEALTSGRLIDSTSNFTGWPTCGSCRLCRIVELCRICNDIRQLPNVLHKMAESESQAEVANPHSAETEYWPKVKNSPHSAPKP